MSRLKISRPLAFSLALFAVAGCECEERLAPLVGSIDGLACDPATGQALVGGKARFVGTGPQVSADIASDGTFFLDEVNAGVGTLVIAPPSGEAGRAFELEVLNHETVDFVDGACGQVIVEPEPTPDVVTPEPTPEPAPVPEPSEPEPPVPTGSVSGFVCAPDGTTWLVGAQVSVTLDSGETVATTTGEDGGFLLEDVPVGEQDITIVKGSFTTVVVATIEENTLTELPAEECAIEIEVRMAMVAHSQYERVQEVLLGVGVEASVVDQYGSDWATTLVGDYAVLSQYDVVFLPCRAFETTYLASTVLQDNLRAFVAAGGSLYTSDQSYDLLENTFPDKIDFHGDDTVLAAADRGAIVNALPATVTHPGLESFLGGATVEIHQALETWSVMDSAADDVTVYLRADAPLLDGTVVTNSPLIISFAHGDGQVLYSSFHQEPGVSADQEAILRFLIFEL